jgi:hypothetical protein
MGSQDSKPQPAVSPPLARHGEHPSRRPRSRPGAGRPENYVTVEYSDRAFAEKGAHGEITNIVSEIFKEELTYRAQARKFLWEFFD